MERFKKIVNGFGPSTFLQNAPFQIFDGVLNTPQATPFKIGQIKELLVLQKISLIETN